MPRILHSLICACAVCGVAIAHGQSKATYGDRFGSDPAKTDAAAKAMAKARFSERTADMVWHAYLAAPDGELRSEYDAKSVKTADRVSPYKWRFVGEKPKKGWGLVIALHGGGGAPKDVNDREWDYMFSTYYADHPEAAGYVYLALRAPNDAWNGFYDDAISPLVERLILQFVKYAEVDPDRVYLCGASHGGYGAFVIGPKIPYRFAAVHPAASADSGGETAGENLRNLRFTWAVGETDKEYGRIDRCRAFQQQWDLWRTKYGGFDGGLEVVAGQGHIIGRFEHDKVAELRKYSRNAKPTHVVWVQTDNVLHRFYWVEALQPAKGGSVEAVVEGNRITLTTKGQGELALWLSNDLVDLGKPISVIRDGKSATYRVRPSLETYAEGVIQTGDPELSAPVRLVIPP